MGGCLSAGGLIGADTLLDVDKIRQLIEMMVANDLVEISLRDGDVEVNLRRPNANAPVTVSLPEQAAQTVVQPAVQASGTQAQAASEDQVDESELVEIASPMVGTFYVAQDPDSPPFVTPGTQVHQGTVVCILEAMKVFNEIKAEVSGFIERVLVKDEQPVEYGQPLFLVRPM